MALDSMMKKPTNVQRSNMKMSTLKSLVPSLAGLVFGLLLAMPVQATLVPVDPPFPAGSWGQGFNETGVGNFTQVETIFISGAGGGFEWNGPPYTGLAAGWTIGLSTSAHVIATGPAINNMTWTIRFLGTTSQALTFDFYAWNGNTLAEKARASWNGSYWTITGAANDLPGPGMVPEPGTILAGALLLIPFGVSTMRIMRKRKP
jgi:hypothetical protein